MSPIFFFTLYIVPFFKLIKYRLDRYNPSIAQILVEAPTETTLSFEFMKLAKRLRRFPWMPPTKKVRKKIILLNFFYTIIKRPNIENELTKKC